MMAMSMTRCQVWYGVPAHASEALEEAMADALPHLFDAAPNLIYQLVGPLAQQCSGACDRRCMHGAWSTCRGQQEHSPYSCRRAAETAARAGPVTVGAEGRRPALQVTMVSPKQLAARGVPVYRLVHEEGSFVVTFPNAFHSGFNTGAFTSG
jgi:JmjC domain, hydroxylase